MQELHREGTLPPLAVLTRLQCLVACSAGLPADSTRALGEGWLSLGDKCTGKPTNHSSTLGCVTIYLAEQGDSARLALPEDCVATCLDGWAGF